MQTPSDVMVGQPVALSANVDGAPTGATITYKWEVGGDKIKSYTQTTEYSAGPPEVFPKGEKKDLTTADLKSKNVSFYFIDGSFDGKAVTVKCDATVNGKKITATGTIKVFRPRVDSFKSTWSNSSPPWGVRPQDPTDPEPIYPTDYALKLGNGVNEGTGILWTAKVTTPDNGAGRITFLQLINFNVIYTPISGNPIPKSSSGVDVLDNTPHDDPNPDVKPMYGDPVGVSPGTQASLVSGDSPSSGVFNSKDKAASIDNHFKTYLMYKPATGGIWVTLGVLNWNASASATKSTSGVWSLDAGALPASGGAGPGSSNSTVLPLWSNSAPHILSQ